MGHRRRVQSLGRAVLCGSLAVVFAWHLPAAAAELLGPAAVAVGGIAAADLNADGVPDLVVIVRVIETDEDVVERVWGIRPGDGAGGFGPPFEILIPGTSRLFARGTGTNIPAFSDFNRDGNLDFVFCHDRNLIAVLGDGAGGGTATIATRFEDTCHHTEASVGDFDCRR